MPNGPMRITGLPFDPNNFESDHKIEDEEIQVILIIFVISSVYFPPKFIFILRLFQTNCLTTRFVFYFDIFKC